MDNLVPIIFIKNENLSYFINKTCFGVPIMEYALIVDK